MALGGGSFSSYNKVLPGVYINFVSASSVSANVGDRGVCAVAMELDWGKEGEIFTVENNEFQQNSLKLFGYSYTSDEMKCLRDLFDGAKKVHVYRLGTGVKATNASGSALYPGVCGNLISTKVSVNIDNNELFDVTTYYNGVKKDVQVVREASELTDNDFVLWDKTATLTAGGVVSMTGGANATVKGEDYQSFLDACESVSFNTLAVASEDENVNGLVAAFTKRMREEKGVKFQSVLYRCAADDIGVVNVHTMVADSKFSKASLVWFVAGALAGCSINKSLTNKVYKGSFKNSLKPNYTQSELEDGIKEGKFMLHSVDGEYRVLADINSFVTINGEMGEVFCENQTIRIIDQIAIDDAKLFTSKYLGVVPNDSAGRLSLWNDITEHRRSLMKMRAIDNFKDEDVKVEMGKSKTSVVITSRICPINAMTQLYISTTVE